MTIARIDTEAPSANGGGLFIMYCFPLGTAFPNNGFLLRGVCGRLVAGGVMAGSASCPVHAMGGELEPI